MVAFEAYLSLALPFLSAVPYLILLPLALRRLPQRETQVRYLAVYLFLAFALQVTQALITIKVIQVPGQWELLGKQVIAIALAGLLAQMLMLSLNAYGNRWVVFGGIATLVVAAILFVLQNLLVVFLAWGVVIVGCVYLLGRALRQVQIPIMRNRLTYWVIILFLVIINDVFIFYTNYLPYLPNNILRVTAASFLTYAILRGHLPDTRDLTRQFLIYFTTALLTMAVYVGGFLLAEVLFSSVKGYNSLFAGAGVSVIISLVFSPTLNAIRGVFNRLFKVETYDASQTLRDYSTSISNILDLEKLATMSVGLIMEVLDVDKGTLFLVDPEIGEGGHKIYRLSAIRGASNQPLNNGLFAENSPLAHFLIDRHEGLLQYDVDFSPDFRDAPINERKWLSSLGMDVYVPVYSKGEWIGLLALGPKGSGRRYTSDDLNLLAAIASQTGVGLENARLVENLRKLNNQIREAYAFLDKANHDLASLEITKSNFISIASHELRTPLTVARGYAEMLLEDPGLQDGVRELVKGIHKATLRLHEIMDSMFDIAQLDARTQELHRQDVFVTELVHAVAQDLRKTVAERQQELNLDLPQLPSIKADPNILRKMFYHLIVNAVKFTPNKGTVTLTGRNVAANNRDLPEGGVEIIVTDTGVGIDKAYQEIIFTKFYQPGELLNRHSTGKTKFKGSGVGLGLALSRGIVEAHGGKIWVESEGYDEDKCPGSSFHVVLPLRSQGESKTVRMGSAVKLKL